LKPVLLDTGVIVALLDRSERYHSACRDAVENLRRPLVTCEAVIAESCYLLRNLSGAPEAVVRNVEESNFQIYPVLTSAAEVRKSLAKYRGRRADFADACLIVMASQLNTGDILTLDRDFTFYRWSRNKAFRILNPLLS